MKIETKLGTFECVEYLPIAEKVGLIQQIVNNCIEDDNDTFVNPIKQDIVTAVFFVDKYMPEMGLLPKEEEKDFDVYEPYDKIAVSSVLEDMCREEAVYNEYCAIKDWIDETIAKIEAHRSSLVYFLERLGTGAIKTAGDFEEMLKNLQKPENLEAMKNLMELQEQN